MQQAVQQQLEVDGASEELPEGANPSKKGQNSEKLRQDLPKVTEEFLFRVDFSFVWGGGSASSWAPIRFTYGISRF